MVMPNSSPTAALPYLAVRRHPLASTESARSAPWHLERAPVPETGRHRSADGPNCWDDDTAPPLLRCCGVLDAGKRALHGCCGRCAYEPHNKSLLYVAMASAEPAENTLERLSSSIETLDREDGRISAMNPSASAAEQVRHRLRYWGLSCALRAHARCALRSRSRQLRAVAQTQAALRAAKLEMQKAVAALSLSASELASERRRTAATAGAAPAAATDVAALHAALAEAQAAAQAARAEAAKERTRGAEIQKRAVAGMEDLTKLAQGMRAELSVARSELTAERERAAAASLAESHAQASLAELMREKAAFALQLRDAHQAAEDARKAASMARKEAAGGANSSTDAAASAEAASAEAARANAALEAANKRHAEMEAALAEVVAEHERSSSWAPDELVDAKVKLAAATVEKTAALAELAAVKKRLAGLEAAGAVSAVAPVAPVSAPDSSADSSLKWELSREKERAAAAVAAARTVEAELAQTREALEASKAELLRSAKLLNSAVAEVQKEREARNALNTAMTSTHQELDEALARLASLTAQKEAALAQLAPLEAKASYADSARLAAAEELATSSKEVARLRAELSTSQQEVRAKAVEAAASRSEMDALQKTLADVRAQAEGAVQRALADAAPQQTSALALAKDELRATQAQLALERESVADQVAAAEARAAQARKEAEAVVAAAQQRFNAELLRQAGLAAEAHASELSKAAQARRLEGARTRRALSRVIATDEAAAAVSRAAREGLALMPRLVDLAVAPNWITRLLVSGSDAAEFATTAEAFVALAREDPAAFQAHVSAGAASALCCCIAALQFSPDAQLWGLDLAGRFPDCNVSTETLTCAAVLVVCALRKYGANAAIQLCGLSSLRALVAGSAAPREAACRAGAHAAVRAALSAHASNTVIVEAAQKALDALPRQETEDDSELAQREAPVPDAPATAVADTDVDAVFRAAVESLALAAASSSAPRSGEEELPAVVPLALPSPATAAKPQPAAVAAQGPAPPAAIPAPEPPGAAAQPSPAAAAAAPLKLQAAAAPPPSLSAAVASSPVSTADIVATRMAAAAGVPAEAVVERPSVALPAAPARTAATPAAPSAASSPQRVVPQYSEEPGDGTRSTWRRARK